MSYPERDVTCLWEMVDAWHDKSEFNAYAQLVKVLRLDQTPDRKDFHDDPG